MPKTGPLKAIFRPPARRGSVAFGAQIGTVPPVTGAGSSTQADQTASGAGTHFTPAGITGLAAWYDAADTATITSASTLVSQWNDKSGNARHVVQAVSTNKPKTGTRTQNGLNVIDFDGDAAGFGDYLDRLGSPFWYGLGTMTAFVVFLSDSVPFTTGCLITEELTSSIEQYAFRYTTTDSHFLYVPDSNILTFNIAGADVDTATPHLIIMKDSGVLAGLQVDANAEVTAAYARTSTILNNFVIGGKLAGNRFHDGWIAEIIIYDTVLGSTDRGNVKTYLQTKWNV